MNTESFSDYFKNLEHELRVVKNATEVILHQSHEPHKAAILAIGPMMMMASKMLTADPSVLTEADMQEVLDHMGPMSQITIDLYSRIIFSELADKANPGEDNEEAIDEMHEDFRAFVATLTHAMHAVVADSDAVNELSLNTVMAEMARRAENN